ncbi:MAG: hypothetical protein MUD01_24125 [Chloroflexaceae bacterium]|jgi:hypothetical protein|nr:hypothetical protein [Chloroflexaceae bacterium]
MSSFLRELIEEPPVSLAASLPLESLAQRCAEETEKFTRRQLNDTQFCFELLRRALADGVSEAFTRVYQVYERMVVSWVYSHSRFGHTGEEADFFARAALAKFYFALRGEKFSRFPTLAQALAYLKLCVHTEIAQYLRDQNPGMAEPLDETNEPETTPDLEATASAQELWDRIMQLLPDEQDRRLARYVFAQDLKPRQIVTLYPGTWRDEREVTLAVYRIRRVLRNDAELQRMLGGET